jgi:hypothetical protein
MNDRERREFLKNLARTAAYAAPVVLTFQAPAELLGQGKSSQHKPAAAPFQQPAPAAEPAPWNQPPPGSPPP